MDVFLNDLKFFGENVGALSSFSLWGNDAVAYVTAGVLFLFLLIVFFIFKRYVLQGIRRFAQTTKTDLDDALVEMVLVFKGEFYAYLSLYITIHALLQFPEIVFLVLKAILLVWIVAGSVTALTSFISYIVKKRGGARYQDTASALATVQVFVRIFLWALGAILILANLGVNVSSLIAGFGIGGIAVALAVQNILGDLFSSFSILFDRPFSVGDYIEIGETKGVVEKIGIKTTRLRSLQGEQIVVSNQDLVSQKIHNFKRLQRRRVSIDIGVSYMTPIKKLHAIPDIIRRAIGSIEGQSRI